MGKLSIIIRSGTRENDREEPAKQEQQQQRQQQHQQRYPHRYQKHRQSSCNNNAKVISYRADSSAANNSSFDVCEETATVRSGTRGQPPRALNAPETLRNETTYSLYSFCATIDSDNSVANRECKEQAEVLVVGKNCTEISSSSSLSSSSSSSSLSSSYSSLLRKSTRGLSRSIILALLVMSVLYEPALGVPAPASSSSASYELQQQVEAYSRFLEFEENYEEEVLYEPTATATPTSAGHSSKNVLGDEELEIIRRSIVESLGLQRIPDPSKANVSQTEYERAHREYLKKVQLSQNHVPPQESRKRKRLHVFHATEHSGNRTRRETIEAEEIEDEVVTEEEDETKEEDSEILQRLFFPVEIPEDLDEEDSTIDHASLRFLLAGDHLATNNNNDLEILVYLRNEQLCSETIALSSSSSFKTRTTTRRKSPQVRRRIRLDDPRDSKWLEVDVTELAIACLLDERKNLELDLLFLQNGSPIRRVFTLPALNVFTTASYDTMGNNNGNRRRKRAAPDKLMSLHKGRRTECREDNKKCCRHEMTVIFKDLKGFEFIVQPKTFDAGYCKGRCPPRYNPAHHHALLQSLIWKEDRRKAPRPCCAPSKLTELEILYFDENDSTSLKVSNWKNMRVLECACS